MRTSGYVQKAYPFFICGIFCCKKWVAFERGFPSLPYAAQKGHSPRIDTLIPSLSEEMDEIAVSHFIVKFGVTRSHLFRGMSVGPSGIGKVTVFSRFHSRSIEGRHVAAVVSLQCANALNCEDEVSQAGPPSVRMGRDDHAPCFINNADHLFDWRVS